MVDSSSTSSSRRDFARKFVIFVALTVAVDAGIGALLRHLYFRQISGQNYRTTYVLNAGAEQMFVFGSSRAKTNYVPTILTEGLGLSCWNAGRDGQSLLFARAGQLGVMARHRPDVVILDVVPTDFYTDREHYDRLSALLPYYRRHPEIRPIVRSRSESEHLKLLSGIYPFNSLPLQILKYNFTPERSVAGHSPGVGTIIAKGLQDATPRPLPPSELDQRMVAALEGFVRDCEEAGIQLFLVVSPVYRGQLVGRENLARVHAVLADTRYELWDYSDHRDLAFDGNLFADLGHMNGEGAARFTQLLTERIGTALARGPEASAGRRSS